MVQKEVKPRGRPKSYDREEALMAAMMTFWKAGYAGTSLDDLSAAMAMNRPSIYAAFGDKRALYLEVIDFYRRRVRASFDRLFDKGLPLCETLQAATAKAIETYVEDQKGCFVVGTAITEAAVDDDVRAVTAEMFREIEQVFAQRFREAAARGQNLIAPPEVLGALMSDVVHGCSLKARAGQNREEIEASARRSIDMICGRGTV